MYLPLVSENFFYPKLDFSWLMYPPPPNQKIFFYLKLDLSWPMYLPLVSEIFFLSKVRFQLADVPSPTKSENIFLSGVRFQMADVPPTPGLKKKSSKNEMFIFGLRLTSDDWPSDPSNESQLKCEKSPLSHQKMKCLFLDYVQLLMIGQAIQAMKVN